MKKLKIWIIPLAISITSLAIGASFHGFRMHPENTHNYNIGVAMGISMASLAAISFLAFIVCVLIYRKNYSKKSEIIEQS